MKFRSTRGDGLYTLEQAIKQGLAPDGGLFIPENFPKMKLSQVQEYPDFSAELLRPFFSGSRLEPKLKEICKNAFNFAVPLKDLADDTAVLELFHGPTAAFKDFGARFLAEYLTRLDHTPRTILVATSGDTGGAVAAAFYKKPYVEVGILFPRGRISPLQEKQLTCWGENIFSFAVNGTFDDCQKIVKESFSSQTFTRKNNLTSANSINVGRLLPQVAYYAYSSLKYFEKKRRKPGFIIPSGNVGNATACFWAAEMGFPIREIVMATNANKSIPDFFETGKWAPRATIQTLANAMDVGNPSNMERLLDLFHGDVERLRKFASSYSVSDNEIKDTIRDSEKKWGFAVCPHTATAFRVRENLKSRDWTVVATASPAKFREIVEPLVGHPIELPDSLQDILKRPVRSKTIENSFEDFAAKWETRK